MQVTCLRENLSRGLANISRAVAARATLPVTQNVLLEGDNGQLKLTATNTEIDIAPSMTLPTSHLLWATAENRKGV